MIDQVYQETDPAQLEQMVKRAAKIVYDEAPVVVLYRNVIAYAMKDSLDFAPTANSMFVELKNLRLKG